MKSPADQLLFVLKTRGPQTTGEAAARLGISPQATRLHLEKLETQGLAEQAMAKGQVGRPRQTWALTDAGHLTFPDTHAQMTVELIEAVREEFGPQGLERLVARREQATHAGYHAALEHAAGLEPRLRALVELRSAEGYMATWGRRSDGSYLLVENHCPICAAATACQGFCRSELEMFQALLAPATVTRAEHILEGARRCAYVVTPG